MCLLPYQRLLEFKGFSAYGPQGNKHGSDFHDLYLTYAAFAQCCFECGSHDMKYLHFIMREIARGTIMKQPWYLGT